MRNEITDSLWTVTHIVEILSIIELNEGNNHCVFTGRYGYIANHTRTGRETQ